MQVAKHAGWGARGGGPSAPQRKHRHLSAEALSKAEWAATCGLMALLLMSWQSQCWAASATVRISAVSAGGDATISVVSSAQRPVELDSLSLTDPPRLVFDLPDATIPPDQPRTLAVNAAGLQQQMRVGQFQADPPIARVVVDLQPGAEAPVWEVQAGASPAETLIVLRAPGPRPLSLPIVAPCGKGMLLRFSGVGALARRVGKLEDPLRVYVDLTDAEVEASQARPFAEGLLAEVRIAQQAPQSGRPVARLVVEMREDAAHGVFADGGDLVVAVGGEPWALPLPAYHGSGRLRGRRIVVDPGHGGQKVGAVGVLGDETGGVVYEKDLTLDIGLRLARVLSAEGAEVVMTRSDDSDVSLSARSQLANTLNADAFVSVHCNSCDTPNSLNGTMVFYDHPHSVGLAGMVKEELIASLGTEDKGVRNANFDVIRRTRGLGILVETAFINNDNDRDRLLNPNFQERTARAIARGLIRFLNQPRAPEAATR